MAWFSRKTNASLPSSAEPLSAAGRWKYDVFLSFMGPDTRRGFTSYLYDALQSRGIKTFMDDQDLQVSDAISPSLLRAIEESRFAIVILSQNYASSTWCLEELTRICECMKDDYRILPLFYYVEPSDVRYQKRSFAEAFSAHEISERHPSEKVQQWRAALNKVANFSGWTTKDFASERELLQNIVEFVESKVLQAPIEIESTMWLEDEPADPRWKYDVFLSFKGEDTRKGFLSHLYHELQNRGVIKTFKDDLEPGEGVHISPTFLKAIEESRFAIVVLTPNYASSPWCLDELTYIFHCMEDQQRILPIFYHVEPSDVRYQEKSFQIAFTKHKKRQDEEKVKQWSTALKKVANLSGWDSRNYKTERQLVEDIVAFVYYKVQAHHIEFESVEHKKPTDVESLIPIEDSEARTHATDQTLAPRSQRHCSFLPSAPRWKHEVFLSFSNVDACKGITSEIYDNLQNIRGVKTFMNNQEFQVGDLTSPRFLTTIEESRFAIVVLSQNYASSTWCLEELTTIVQCMKDNDRVLPLFYQVDPSAVRYQRESFEVAFKNHESTEDMAKVKQWRNALKKVADLPGWESHEYGSDKELVEDIVKLVWGKVLQVRIDNESTIRQPKDMTSSRSLASAKPAPRWKYDVFLSFRGEDTRENILSHLYRELSDTRGVKTFKDDQNLEQGTAISPNLLMAIEESKFAVVVLSANYASSTWCLDELIHIFKCMEGKNTILPIFYHVDPSHVQKQEGSFKKAFEQHENSGQDEQKMQQWREALKKVATVSGWHSKKYKSESELVEHVGKFVWSKVIQVEVDSTMSTGDFEAFRATRQGMEQVMKALKNDKVYVIGVYGRGGVGKTTMVKHVTAQAQKIGLFNHVFMVSLSQSPDLRKIQVKFAAILGLKFQEETDIEKATRLKKRIMGGHKILIVLDNIWNSIDLSSIGIPSSSELQRCNAKVLITTRKIEVCQAMGCQENINLTMLSEADSLTLFMRQSGKSLEPKDFYDAARKVAKQCAGLPIALKAVAKALGDKVDLNEWKKAARRLKKSRTANLDDEGDAFNCIKLSYDYLKGEYVKSCFLLCCLFPDDDDIRIADLMEYGYGIGLFQDSSTMKEARATTHLAVIYLKACNLLMDGAEDGCIRMHDVIRNMAISILHKNGHHFFPPGKTEDGHHFSSPGKKDDGHPSFKPEKEEKDGHHFLIKAGCQLKEWPMDADESYSGISVMRNEILKLPEELICSKLQILLLQGNADINDIPDTFIQSVNSMRVLDLSDTRISSLPPSFSLLKNLHTLYLDGCQSLIDVSALGELRLLEILSMRQCCFKELPMEIGQVSDLRILDITSEFVNTVPPNAVSRLHRLEELYMQCKFMDWSSNGKGAGNAGFDELTGLSHLYILKVNISDPDCLPKIVEFSPNWEIFDIRISRETLPRDYSSKPYFKCDHSRILTLSTAINTLPDWFIMSVTKKADILQYIECNELNNMLVEHERGILHGLKYLAVIGRHEKLEELMNTKTCVPVPNEPVFESMEELHLAGLNCLKELCVGELPPQSLCNIKLLKVEACPNLVNALLPSIFCNLTILVVRCCMKLKSLFTPDVARCLLQLEDLSVAQCACLNRVIEASKKTVEMKMAFPKLKKLVLCNLPQLTWFYCTGNATIYCPSLQQLYVQDCPEFLTSTSDFQTWKQVEVSDLRHLRYNVILCSFYSALPFFC